MKILIRKTLYGTFALLVLIVASGRNLAADGEFAGCGLAVVRGEGSCSGLSVQFDLSTCAVEEKTGAPHVTCVNSVLARAAVQNSRHRYEVTLTRNSDDLWLAGAVRLVHPLKEENVRAATSPQVTLVALPSPVPTLAVTPTSAPNVVSAPLSVKGSFRLRGETLDKTDFVNYRSGILLRARLDAGWIPFPDAFVFLQPQVSKAFGEPLYIGSSPTANTRKDTSGNTTDTSITLHQGYVDLQPSQAFKFRLGRQVLNYGEGLIIGAADWQNVGRSFDAARVTASYDFGSTDLFASKLQDNNLLASGPGDKNFYGLYNSMKLSRWAESFDLYLLGLQDQTTKPGDLLTAGLRAKSTIGVLDYRLECDRQWNAVSAYQVDLEIGLNTPEVAKARVSAEYFRGSDQYNQLFPSIHAFLGYADVVGRRNLTGFAFHGAAALDPKLWAQLDYYSFRRTNNSAPVYRKDGVLLTGATGPGSPELGSELDLTFKLKPNKSLSWYGGASVFFTGQYLTEQFGSVHPLFYFIQMEVLF